MRGALTAVSASLLIACLGLLAGLACWDWYEARRTLRLARIVSSEEQAGRPPAWPRMQVGADGRLAEAFYAAAAMLDAESAGVRASGRGLRGLAEALRQAEYGESLSQAVAISASSAVVLGLVEHGRTAHLRGSSMSVELRTGLVSLSRLLEIDFLVLMRRGQLERASARLLDRARVMRQRFSDSAPVPPAYDWQSLLQDIAWLLETPAIRQTLARRLRGELLLVQPWEACRDEIRRDRLAMLAQYRQGVGDPALWLTSPATRPWARRALNRGLTIYSRLLDATRDATPGSLQAADALLEESRGSAWSAALGARVRQLHRCLKAQASTSVVRTVIEVLLTPSGDVGQRERDPYSDGPIRVSSSGGTLIAYSVGGNGLDDGGVVEKRLGEDGPDLGLRIDVDPAGR